MLELSKITSGVANLKTNLEENINIEKVKLDKISSFLFTTKLDLELQIQKR
jgi:hypothetical protein